MRCKICGATLKKDGDICSSCYKIYQEEKELEKDTSEQLVIKRKYIIAYNLFKHTRIFIIFIMSLLICIASREWLGALAVTGIFFAIIGILLFIDKRLAIATKAVFYVKKVDYVFDSKLIKNTKTVKYENIRDIKIYKTPLQKKFDLGDICVYAKGTLPGSTLLNGFQIKNVENPSETVEQIEDIIGLISK